jgi:glycosyltransferase involved in cell wall biosynthesis
MKLLHVTREEGSDKRYGLGKSIAPLIRELTQRNWVVAYLCKDNEEGFRQKPTLAWKLVLFAFQIALKLPNLKHLASAMFERLQVGRSAINLAILQEIKLIHFHDPWLAIWAAFSMGRSSYQNIRWGITQHGFGSYCKAVQADGLKQGKWVQFVMLRLERIILARAAWVILPTMASLSALQNDLNLPSTPKHWHVIWHPKPHVSEFSKLAARSKLGWDIGWFVILLVGRLVPLKQVDSVIEVCSSLITDNEGIHLQVIGDGDWERYTALANCYGFGDRFHIDVSDDVTTFYRASDLYLSFSSTESFGLANLEAICHGLPSICTDVGGVREVVGDAAHLVRPDKESLKVALETLLIDETRRKNLSTAALKRGALWPDALDITNQYVERYQEHIKTSQSD